ncbi:MAG TPA: glycosyltransferase [Candidatus Atribacteria bacterium]|nr:glycosyltransferase [Candidatus Atribacteria bacterium]
MKEPPIVSIIIPVKNASETIEDLLKSLMNLDYPKDKIEIIIIDGQSTDDTIQKASKYPVKILTEPGLGPGYARKIGIEASRGEILAFTDGDCIVPKEWIKVIVEDLSQPEIGCVGGSIFVDENIKNNIYAVYADKSIMRIMPLAEKKEILDEPKIFKHLAFCNMAIKRKVIKEIGNIDIQFKTFEDVDTVQSICEIGYKMMLDPRMYVWHKHRQSLKAILKQTYSYGKGGPKFRRKHPKSRLAKFYRRGLIAFYTIISILILGIITSILTRNPLPILITSTPFTLGYIAGIIYYKAKRNSLKEAIIFPLIDMLRIFAFCIGDLKASLFER